MVCDRSWSFNVADVDVCGGFVGRPKLLGLHLSQWSFVDSRSKACSLSCMGSSRDQAGVQSFYVIGTMVASAEASGSRIDFPKHFIEKRSCSGI